MVNVVSVTGVSQESLRRKIHEMELGEVGYAVEWAFDEDTQELNMEFTIHEEMAGTASMRVTCVGKGKYKINY